MTLLLQREQIGQIERAEDGIFRVSISFARDYPTETVILDGYESWPVDGTDVARAAVREAIEQRRAVFDRLAGD